MALWRRWVYIVYARNYPPSLSGGLRGSSDSVGRTVPGSLKRIVAVLPQRSCGDPDMDILSGE
jgi:hypothetical protein